MQKNRRNGYTVPCASLYPFQWNWDAGFHALGWMYIDPVKAMDEIRSMFKGQWDNGMLPHVVFHEVNDNYFPGPDIWKINLSKFSPKSIKTTGITQLPVFGFILERMIQVSDLQQLNISDFVKEIFPKIVASHRYLYEYRDPYNEGLPCLFHNWESTDNSPIWDAVWDEMDLSNARDVSAFRKDNKKVDASMRPTDLDYKRYIYLIDLLVNSSYQEDKIVKSHPFLVQENMFIALLIRSNEALINIGKRFDWCVKDLEGWQLKSKTNFNNKFWCREENFYYPFDLNANNLIKKDIVGALVALFAGIPSAKQAGHLITKMNDEFIQHADWFLCPSYSSSAIDFDAKRYWRGPLWPNVNWLLYHGLLRYDFVDLANKVKEQTVFLIENYGMFEYFDPTPEEKNINNINHKGLGGPDFSWTAAVYLDFKYNQNSL